MIIITQARIEETTFEQEAQEHWSLYGECLVKDSHDGLPCSICGKTVEELS